MFELRGGIELRTEKYDGDLDYPRYEKSVIKNVVAGLTRLLKDNRYAKDIIAGWRHGYAPDAVARYLVGQVTAITSTDVIHMNEYQRHAVKGLRELLSVNNLGWGTDYGYTPSISELSRPAAIVQVEINERLDLIRKLINDNNTDLLYVEPKRFFNDPIKNAGAIKHSCEVSVVGVFTEAVFSEVRKLLKPVFVEHVDA